MSSIVKSNVKWWRSPASAYGMVLRFDLGIMVSPDKPAPDEDRSEWRSMGESNVLLSASCITDSLSVLMT